MDSLLFPLNKPIKNFSPEAEKEEFTKLYNQIVHRDGSSEFLNWLSTETDFFDAPASTQYHSNVHGGLLHHSMLVYKYLKKEVEKAGYDMTPERNETIFIVALLHDICKANFYSWNKRNVKDESGTWVSVPYITVDEALPLGHGEKSVMLIQQFMKLTLEEILAIRWHMADFSEAYGACSNAYSMCPLALLTHIADIKATYFCEAKFDYVKNEWVI